MAVKDLPVFVWLALQLVMLPVSLLALVPLALLTACQAGITAGVFAHGSGQTLLHALLCPLRLGVVAAAAANVAAVPAASAWLAQWLYGPGVALSVIFAAAAVAATATGAAWIITAQGIWGYLPPWPPLRLRDIGGGISDSMVDVGAAGCALFVVGTVVRLPWLLIALCSGGRRSRGVAVGPALQADVGPALAWPPAAAAARPDSSTARGELFVQAAFAVADVLLMPAVLALLCTGLRLPRVQQQIHDRVQASVHGHGSCCSANAVTMNSWVARVVVIEQTLLLVFLDILLLLPLLVAVVCSIYRLPAVVLDVREKFADQQRHDARIGAWKFLGKDTRADDVNGAKVSGLATFELAILSQALLLLLDLLFLPPLLLVMLTVWRVPTTACGVQASIYMHHVVDSCNGDGAGSFLQAFRRLDRTAVNLRLVLLREALTVVFLDVPTIAAATLNVLVVYRSVALCRDLCGVIKEQTAAQTPAGQPRSPAARSPAELYKEANQFQAQIRSLVWIHVLLLALDIATAAAFLLLVLTVYRLPKTLRKLSGKQNVWNRTGRHWSTFTLRAIVQRRGVDGQWSARQSGDRAHFYILKRAGKVLTDVVIAVAMLICGVVPWKTRLIVADVQLLLWFKTAQNVDQVDPAGAAGIPQPQAILRTYSPLPVDDLRPERPTGCILGDQLRRSNAGRFLFTMHVPWVMSTATFVLYSLYWSVVNSDLCISIESEAFSSTESEAFSSGSGSDAGFVVHVESDTAALWDDGCTIGIAVVGSLLVVCCCCICYCTATSSTDCCTGGIFMTRNDVASKMGSAVLHDGMSKGVRYNALRQLVWCHFLLLPVDLCIEPICLVWILVLKITGWRYSPLERDAGTSLTTAHWISKRGRRYRYTAWHTVQWLLDFPAVLLLLVLILTVVRSHAVIMDLAHFSNPDRNSRAQRYYSKTQAGYRRLQNGVAAVTQDDETALVRNQKFPEDLSPGLARSERRLAVAKLLHERLTGDMDEEIPFLPLEVVTSIAEKAVPVICVPRDWLLAEEALAAAPPDATILLDPGVHRMQLGKIRNPRKIMIEGTGGCASDVIVIPILNGSSINSDNMARRARVSVQNTPPGSLKNLTVVLEPAVVRARSFSDETAVTEWRQLVWRNGALLLLELPFPILALLCLWRLPQLIRTLRAEDRVFDKYSRLSLTFQVMVQVVLDIPAGVAIALMVVTVWRVPSLLRARANHKPRQSPYRTIASEFFVWLCDVPFAIMCVCMLPFFWRGPRLLETLWRTGLHISPERTTVWRTVVTPTQRILVMRCALLCLLDLACLALLPLLVIFPWRGAQCSALIKYENMCSRLESYNHWQYFNTNSVHAWHRTIEGVRGMELSPSPLRTLFRYEAGIISDRQKVNAVQFVEPTVTSRRHVQHVVLSQPDIDAAGALEADQGTAPAPEGHTEEDTEPAPEGHAEVLEPRPSTRVADDWIEPCEAITFAILYCAFKSLTDFWRVCELAFTLVFGFRHLPFLGRGMIETYRAFNAAGRFQNTYADCDFIDDEIKLCTLLCCLPLLWCCWACGGDLSSQYVGELEECAYTGNLDRGGGGRGQNNGNAQPVPVNYIYGDEVVLSVSPAFSATMLHPQIDKAFAKAMWDLPHLLLIPIKLLAVVMAPSYFYLKWRCTPVSTNGNEAQPLQPIVSAFLLPLRVIVDREPEGLTFWRAHEVGLIFLLITPICVLDLFALLFAKITCVIFAWPLTLLGPTWDAARKTAGFEKLGGLLPRGLSSWKLHATQGLMVFLQVLATPVLLLYVLTAMCGPLIILVVVCSPINSYEDSRLVLNTVSETLVDAFSSGWIVFWFSAAEVIWLLVVACGCLLARQYCERSFPLFNPLRAWCIVAGKLLDGRLLKQYKVLLVLPTIWCYARRGGQALFVGEFLIPVVALVWVIWPVLAVVLPSLVVGHCFPVSRGDCSESTWAVPLVVAYFVVPAGISLILATKCLAVLRRHWRPPLTAAEQSELAREHLELRTVQIRCPSDGVGIVVLIDATKEQKFTAKTIQLQVLAGDEVWEAIGRPLSGSGRKLLPFLRRSLLPFDLTACDCMEPASQLRKGQWTAMLEIRVGCTGQPKATNTAEMRTFLQNMAHLWNAAPDITIRLEHPTPLGWANTLEVSASPVAIARAIGDPGDVCTLVRGPGGEAQDCRAAPPGNVP